MKTRNPVAKHLRQFNKATVQTDRKKRAKNGYKKHKVSILSCLIVSLMLVSTSYAYDGKIKDKYGRVTGYVSQDGDDIEVYDKYGKKEAVVEDTKIKDKYGKTKGYIELD